MILVGVMRDLETIGAALTAAETGHLVFAREGQLLAVPFDEERLVATGPEVLDTAPEILLTSTSWEVLAVTTWNGQPVGDGRRGETARLLQDGFRELCEKEDS